MENYTDAVHVAEVLRPVDPVFCLRPKAVKRAARWFANHFPGRCLYAVKANPAPWVIETLRDEGISFDVASLDEARRVRALAPEAMIGFMHPVKAPEAIREAYFDLGVRIFSLDTVEELEKILAATDHASDLTLCVRLTVSSALAKISLASKFGVAEGDDVELLRRTRQAAMRLGVCFHVGSQAMAPTAFLAALDRTEKAIVRAGVIIDVLDVGGGFPARYPGMEPGPLVHYIDAITDRFESMLVAENCELWCEPGRALCAEAASLILRVEGRKGDQLYVNDGVYGALFDAGSLDWTYPVRALRAPDSPTEIIGFSLFGPTCDDYDHMKGPFYLPESIAVGDYIEVGVIGAYGAAMKTRFNGFGDHLEVIVDDEPMMSAYAETYAANDDEQMIREDSNG